MVSRIVQAVNEALSRGYQVHPDLVPILENLASTVDPVELIIKAVSKKQSTGDLSMAITPQDLEVALPGEMQYPKITKDAQLSRTSVTPTHEFRSELEITNDPTSKVTTSDGPEVFNLLFRSRFRKLTKIIEERPDSRQIRKISSLNRVANGGVNKIAGLVLEKKVKKGHVELTVDDHTGKMTALVTGELQEKVKSEICLDQLAVLDIEFSRKGLAFVKEIHTPDIPDHIPSRVASRVYAVFTSDLQVGSRAFMKDAFQRFIVWMNEGDEERSIRDRIGYLIVGGDVVDGIGVYPGQEHELEELDVRKQYKAAALLLEQIPKDIQIVVSPGNHDATRQALPQPAIPRMYAEPLYELPNVIMTGNPVQMRIHGLNVLTYHGRSLDDIVATTPGVSLSRPALAAKLLLKARHLAPIFGKRTPIAPEPEDHLVIEDVPDILHVGHTHILDAESYKGTLIVCSGTWQKETAYQANIGLIPTPALVPIVNLSTLELIVKDFGKEKESGMS